MGLLGVAVGLCLLVLAPAHSKPLRGLDPALASKYDSASGKFTCLDGSKTISFQYVNDDFCDCADGSDEPGTSACATGSFYCRNLGHVPKTISSVFVDDGVCDCCDGKDEKSGCTNKCLEEAAAIKEALQTKLANYEAALAKKQSYLEQAKIKRAEMVDRRANIDQEIEDKKAQIMELKDEKSRLDEEEAVRKAEEEAAAAAAAAQQAEQQGAAAAEGAEQDAQAHTRSLQEEPAAGTDEVAEVLQEETAEERGRRIAAQWTNDPDAAMKAEEQADPVPDEHVHEPHVEHGLVARAKAVLQGLLDRARQMLGGKSKQASKKASESAAQQVQQRIWSEESALADLEETRRKLDRQLVMDFGPDDLFLPLLEQCFDADAVKYVYSVCMFEKAVQKEGYQETDIGKWGQFHTEGGVTKMVYDNGAYCWEGPNRSMSVTLECGLEEKLKDGGEPSKCVYAASLETPAMCSAEERKELTKRLEDLEELERTIAQQIKDEL